MTKDCLLNMQAIFRLIKQDGLRGSENGSGNFFSGMSGHTVHEEGVGFGSLQDVGRYLIG